MFVLMFYNKKQAVLNATKNCNKANCFKNV